MYQLRKEYPALLDGFSLEALGTWTSPGVFPESNGTVNEWGVWSVAREGLPSQILAGPHANTSVWLVYSNLNDSSTIATDCSSPDYVSTPFLSGQTIRNLFHPCVSPLIILPILLIPRHQLRRDLARRVPGPVLRQRCGALPRLRCELLSRTAWVRGVRPHDGLGRTAARPHGLLPRARRANRPRRVRREEHRTRLRILDCDGL